MELSTESEGERGSADLDALHARYVEVAIENELLRGRLTRYEMSRTHKLASKATRLITVLLPPGSRRRRGVARLIKLLKFVLRLPSEEERAHQAYGLWLAARTPDEVELEQQTVASRGWSYHPLISVCMPVYNPEPSALDEAISSVQRQSYEHWELCICDDASTRGGVAELLKARAESDPRIKLSMSAHNSGISGATNQALSVATGDYVAFLDDDDVLEARALYRCVQELQSRRQVDVLYTDEDILLPTGRRVYPLLKPGWSPEALLSMNYITHFVLARRAKVERVGGLRPERDGAQDHDLLLRLSEVTDAIVHVPEVLYSWRQSSTSTSMSSAAKPWAYEAGLKAVDDALKRRHLAGTVEPGVFPGAYRVRYTIPVPHPPVTILIPTRDRVDLLRACIGSVRKKTAYSDYSIVVVDNDSQEPATKQYLAEEEIRTIEAPGPFNYAAVMNTGFAGCDTELVLTLNNDTLITDPEWLTSLVELAGQPDVGAIGCRLVFGDGRLQHEGIVLGCGPPAANLSFGAPGIRVVGVIPATREVTAVTGACCLIRRSAWEAIGGFDESFRVAYNDVDFCLRLRQHGYRILFTPYVSLVHEESSSRGPLHPPEDEALLVRRWAAELAAGDPYFPRGLGLGSYGLRLIGDDRRFRGEEMIGLVSGGARSSGADAGQPPAQGGTGPARP